jgi:hypothetical protein
MRSVVSTLKWNDVTKFYCLPVYSPGQEVSEEIQQAMLACYRASSSQEVKTVFQSLGIHTGSDVRGRTSLSKARTFFGTFVGVTVLSHAPGNFTQAVRCGCWKYVGDLVPVAWCWF